MTGVGGWIKHRWAAHVDSVKLRRWQSVAYESDDEGLELGDDDQGVTNANYVKLARGEMVAEGGLGATTPRPTSGAE